MKAKVSRIGFTLAEVLIVAGIVTLLLGLVAMGVQQAREASRRLSCQNNLHQIGIAVTNFVSYNKRFPSLFGSRGAKGVEAFEQTPFRTLLRELEIQIDDSKEVVPELDLPPSVLQCASGNKFLGYRFSFGSGVRTRDNLDGVMQVLKGLSPAEITDGLSNTCVASERMSGTSSQKPLAVAVLPNYPDDEAFIRDCEQVVSPINFVRELGFRWKGFLPVDIGYSHAASPNLDRWDCQGGFNHQRISARSYHSSGVYSLRADASVLWSSSNVDQTVWKALGIAAGHETVSND